MVTVTSRGWSRSSSVSSRGASTYQFHVTSRVVTEVELAVKPESVALGAFGAIAGLVCLVLGMQAISRQLRRADEDRQVMRALGAVPVAATGDGLIGVLGCRCPRLARRRSPWRSASRRSSPLGPVRPVYPDAGIAFDWTVLGIGLAVLVVGLGAAAVALSYRGAPHRVARIEQAASVVRASPAAPKRLGCRWLAWWACASLSNRGGAAPRCRCARRCLAPSLAVVMVVATLTFASSLQHPGVDIRRSTGGTGTTRSTRATTSRRKP